MIRVGCFLVVVVLGILYSNIKAQVVNPESFINKTSDYDGDGVFDYIDLDDDNDGILDDNDAFSCGYDNVSYEVDVSNYDFSTANLNSWAVVSKYGDVVDPTNPNNGKGNPSAGILNVYGRTKFEQVQKFGKIDEFIGPSGARSKMFNGQYSTSNAGVERRNNTSIAHSGVYNLAFREDRFDLNQARNRRVFVIEYDWYAPDGLNNKGENNWRFLNEWGTYISNGYVGSVYETASETDAKYKSYNTYKDGLNYIKNNTAVNFGVRAGQPFVAGKWYRVKGKYTLLSSTQLEIEATMTRYENNGTLTILRAKGTDYYNQKTILNVDINRDDRFLVEGFQAGIMTDSYVDNVKMYWLECDTDGDGIPNRLDLDSDNDGCTDAIEGDALFTAHDLVQSSMQGGNTNAAGGNYNKPITHNLGKTVNSDGVPVKANGGQGVGNAYDASQKEKYCACFNEPNNTGNALDTNHGISLLRAGDDNGNWPMLRKGAWTALESSEKGFVVTRMTTSEIQAIVVPQEGMITYDTDLKCLKLYDGIKWSCFDTPVCPTH